MKLKDILPYCLDFSKKPFNTSFNPLYFWVIGGFTYTIDSFESYCPPEVFDEQIHLSRYNFCNHDEIQKKYDPDNNYLSLNLDNEITIFDKFIMVHKTRGQTTDSESKLFFKTHYYVANGHDFSSDCYTLGLYHTDALGGMATNLRTVFKDLIDSPVLPKPAVLTLEKRLEFSMSDDDIQDINSISLDIINFCGMINANDGNSTKIVAEIKDCASTIIEIIKESNNDR